MQLLYIGNRLSSHGFTPTGVEYLGELFERGGFTVRYASSKRNALVRFLDMLFSIVRYRKSDVILIDTYSSLAFYYALACSTLSWCLNIPYVLVLRGGDLPNRVTKTPKLSKWMFTRASRVVSVSMYLFTAMLPLFKTIYIPNTIAISKYPFKGRSDVRPRLLWVRSLHRVYNPALALRLMLLLRKKFADACLVMVGPDKDGTGEQLKTFIAGHDLTDHVKLTGKLEKSDWINLSKEFDIFINTTNVDNMPVSVTEAMALGLPVVSTNVGGVPFLISDGDDGLLVPPNDEQAFYKAIEMLINDRQLVERLTAAARKKAETFDNEIILNKWKELIYEVVS